MQKIFAIARLALASAIRSRILLSLMASLLVILVGLPLTIQSDGTLPGLVRILLSYTLGFSTFILSLAAIWSGCAAVSLEIQDKQAHLLVTKPVSRLQIWLGKWLGLLVLYGFLLLFAGVLIYALLIGSIRPGQLSPAERSILYGEILAARQSIPPDLTAVDERARELFLDRPASAFSHELTPEQNQAAFYASVRREFFTVPPGQERRWTFVLPGPASSAHPLTLTYHFSSSQIGPAEVPGIWRIGTPDDPNRSEVKRTDVAGQPHTLRWPGLTPDGGRRITITYANLSPDSITVLFDPGRGMALNRFAGGFEGNLARALLLIFCQLAWLAAVGLAAGSLFSTPVAAFTSFSALIVLQFGGYIERMSKATLIFEHHTHGGEIPQPSIWDQLFHGIFQLMNIVVHPLQGVNPLELLATGQLIAWPAVGWAVSIKVLIYSGALALITSRLLNRREIGLPA